MFNGLKQAWAQSQSRLNAEQFAKAVMWVVHTSDEVAPDANPTSLYGSSRARQLRMEVRLCIKHARLGVEDIAAEIKRSEAWKSKLTAAQRAAIEVVLAHLRNDPDCNSAAA